MNTRCLLLCLVVLSNLLLGACGGGSSGQGVSSGFLSLDSPADTADTDVPASAYPYTPAGSSGWPLFLYPRPGDVDVDVTKSIQWTPADNARGYQLQVGTTVGGNDVFDSGVITGTSTPMPPLPAGVVIYARVRAVLNNWPDQLPAERWPRGSYTRFRADDEAAASKISNVAAGKTLPAGTPIEWNASPLALGYRVTLSGAAFGGSADQNVFASSGSVSAATDSGVIHTTHIFIDAAANAKVTATLETIYLTHSVTSKLSFIAAGGAPSFAEQYKFAQELTAEVRSMADRDNQPLGATILDAISNGAGYSTASCGQFMLALLQLVGESRVGLNARSLSIAVQQGNAFDTHTLVEVLDAASSRWITLDPTFGLVTLRADGSPATAAEISAAVRAQNWPALQFMYLTDAGAQYAHDYYIDYPLLFINVRSADGSGYVQSPPESLAPYFDSLSLPISSDTNASYALQCAPGFESSTAEWNGSTQTYQCAGSDSLTPIYTAYTLQAAAGDGSTAAAWRLRRFTF